MKHTLSMVDNNVKASLQRAYREMSPLQYIREVYVNAVEAGASFVRFDMVSEGFKKMAVWDNGHGMNPDDLLKLINGRNSSSKSTDGRHGNFGVGLKDSALFANQYGLIVISKTLAKREGGMIWLTIDSDGVAGSRLLVSDEIRREANQYEDPDDFIEQHSDHLYSVDFQYIREELGHHSFTVDGVDWMKIFFRGWKDSVKDHGTCVVFGGNQRHEEIMHSFDTVTSYFKNRFYKLSCAVRVKSGDLSRYTIEVARYCFGGLPPNALSRYRQQHKGFEINTLVLDPRYVKHSGNHKPLMGFLQKTLYGDEMYGSEYTPSLGGAVHLSRRSREARKWGLYAKSVSRRVIITIEPPRYDEESGFGCYPNSTRSQLLWSDRSKSVEGAPLDLTELREWYIQNMPAEVKALQAAALEELHENRPRSSKYKKFQKFFKPPKDQARLTPDGDDGCVVGAGVGVSASGGALLDLFNNGGSPSPGSTPAGSTPPEPTPRNDPAECLEGGDQDSAPKKKKVAIRDPEVEFINEGQEHPLDLVALMTKDGRGKHWYPFYYHKELNRILVNKDSEVFRCYVAQASEWVASRHSPLPDDIIALNMIEPFIHEHLPVSVLHMKADRSLRRLGVRIHEPEYIAVVMHGLWQGSFNAQYYYRAYKETAVITEVTNVESAG